MPVGTIYVARHGFRLSWETTIWNAPTNTPRDPPLSSHGVDQAKELASWFASLEEGERPDAIYSSPLYRCLQTAQPLSDKLELPINVEHGLSEFYLPVKRGLHPRSLPAESLRHWFPTIDPSHTSLLYPPQEGETIDQIHVRSEQVLELLLNKIDAQSGGAKSVVVYTHAATAIALGRALIGDKEKVKDIRAGTCSVSKFTRQGDGSWVQEMNGQCDHLERGEERHWCFEYVEEYEEDGIIKGVTEEIPLASEAYKSPGAQQKL